MLLSFMEASKIIENPPKQVDTEYCIPKTDVQVNIGNH